MPTEGKLNSWTMEGLVEIDIIDVLACQVAARVEARSYDQVSLGMTRCDRLDILSSNSVCTLFFRLV
jgi:hypothetical protein